MSSIVHILEQAKNSLTPETWGKEGYFFIQNNNLRMCAHGAIQALVNPVCRVVLDKNRAAAHPATAIARAVADAVRAALARRMATQSKSLKEIWNDCPDWVKNADTNIHYLLGMVGLTIAFNDDPNTTLEMVHQKFDEAIKLAQELGI